MKGNGILFLAFILLVGLLSLWGCPKKAEVSSAPETQPQKVEQAPAKPAASAVETAKGTEAAAAAKTAGEAKTKEASARGAAGLQPIFFDFDKSFIRDDARSVMKANADYLKANPKVKVRIEGNCDERGTIEYNQALGQRRAASAKKYLTDMGISGNRIKLISYGKEKPVCTEGTEDCWQKNRRDDFVVAGE
jgi:peptidoglycan-associated lipoprotein